MTGWSEENSTTFIDFGDIVTPSRDEQFALICSLIPADTVEDFVAVDLACGAGGLSAAILDHFPTARIIALDGSPVMLDATRDRLSRFGTERFQLHQFDLRGDDWLAQLPAQVRCFVSSLAIHHLDGPEKRELFKRLAQHLEPSGALLIVDIVDPVNDRTWSAYAAAWDRLVREQSLAMTGNLDAYHRFQSEQWNHFATPDLDFDKPSKLFEQLEWLRSAGFNDVDCFWLRSGHALYGGYT